MKPLVHKLGLFICLCGAMVIAVRNLAVIDLGFEPHPWHQNVRNFIFVQFIELDQIFGRRLPYFTL